MNLLLKIFGKLHEDYNYSQITEYLQKLLNVQILFGLGLELVTELNNALRRFPS
jgi:hypothetical protein